MNLEESVSKAGQANLKVILTLAHIPGRSWEFRKRDFRIWRQPRFRKDLVEAWKTIAAHFKGTADIIGYDVFNEPYFLEDQDQNYAETLNSLYRDIVSEIRSVDKETPVIIESSEMASPSTFGELEVLNDAKTIYSFHYYEPFDYFSPSANQGQLEYPGFINGVLWNKSTHVENLQVVRNWQLKNKIESYRIYVGEFGVWRRATGADLYLSDLLGIFQEYGWSWSYYAFRENDWDVTDLELQGSDPIRKMTELFKILAIAFK